MKRITILSSMLLISLASLAQTDTTKSKGLGGLFKKATGILGKTGSASSLSSDEIVQGLKEALSVGAQKSTG